MKSPTEVFLKPANRITQTIQRCERHGRNSEEEFSTNKKETKKIKAITQLDLSMILVII